jgi:hypothetical protein
MTTKIANGEKRQKLELQNFKNCSPQKEKLDDIPMEYMQTEMIPIQI